MDEFKNYLLNNMEELEDIVSQINSYDGSLDYLEYYNNDEEFFSTFFNDPMEAVRSTYYGSYNFTDDLVHFNGYGNLDSCDQYEYEEELKASIDEIIDRLIDLYNKIDVSLELDELLEEVI